MVPSAKSFSFVSVFKGWDLLDEYSGVEMRPGIIVGKPCCCFFLWFTSVAENQLKMCNMFFVF